MATSNMGYSAEQAVVPSKTTLSQTQIPNTKKMNLTALEAAALIHKETKLLILDVRTVEEFAEGHLAKAKNFDVNDSHFSDLTSKLDKKVPVLVYCASGMRSKKARSVLEKQGFEKIYHLDGGIAAWKKAGQSLGE